MQGPSRYREAAESRFQSEDAWISDLDPILEGGLKVSFQQPEFALQVRSTSQQGQIVSVKEIFYLRILTLMSESSVTEVRIQISTEDELFKLYLCNIDEKKFEKIKKAQHLNFGFSQLLSMLVKQVGLCQKHLNQYSAVLQLNKITASRLQFLQNIQYKRIQLLSLDFEQADEDLLKNYVTFRFTKIKMNKQIIEKKLKDVMSITKLKNQNLWNDLVKKQQKLK